MRILVCNDDGVNSPLIKVLANSLRRYGEVLVCAPEGERSAYSQSINYMDHKESNIKDLGYIDGIHYMSHPNTPTDSLLYVLDYVDFKPDLVVSGINRGLNTGIDVYYSGTVGIATEAILRGYDAFAVSIDRKYNEDDLKWIDEIIDKIIKENLYSKSYVLNVNIPTSINTLEYKYTHLDILNKYSNSDNDAIKSKLVSFTPIVLDRTDIKILNKLEKEV